MPWIEESCWKEPIQNFHQVILLEGLNKLRKTGELTDVTITVDGHTFKAHKAVLAACSDYFRAMFIDQMLESKKDIVELYGVSPTGFELLLDYIYTTQLELALVNIVDVLHTATYLQIMPVVHACSNFLGTYLDKENCVDIVTIADNYSLVNLKKAAYKFICRHLSEIATSANFYRLSPDQIENILKLNMPVDCSEAKVLYYVLKWFLNGEEDEIEYRMRYAQNILNHISFNHIFMHTLDKNLENIFSRIKTIKQCRHALYKIIVERIKQESDSICSTSFNLRGMELALVKIGGFGNGGITNEITYCLMSEQKWQHLTSIPHVDQCNFGTAVLNNNLYVVGGCFNQSLQEVIHPFGFKYNPRIDQWCKIAPMNTERCRFTLNASGDKLYAVGGATDIDCFDGIEGTNACECYNSVDDTWEVIRPLPEYRSQHAGAAITVNGQEKIFISGGVYRDNVVATLFCYDVETQTWQTCTPMLTPRADHFMLSYGNKLYICGGWKEITEPGRLRVQVVTIDSYNTLTDTWEIVTRIPTPRYHAGIVADNSKIYIIGGFRTDALFFKDMAEVECYDIATDTWSVGDKSSQDFWEHSCVTLYIPKNECDSKGSKSGP